jgi:hypothetical protein
VGKAADRVYRGRASRVFLTFYELLYVMKLNFIAYSMLEALGHDLRLLLAILDLQ